MDLLTLTEETLNGKLQFLCSVVGQFYQHLRLVKSAIKQLQAVRKRLHEDYNCFNLHREILRRLHQQLQDNEQKEKRYLLGITCFTKAMKKVFQQQNQIQ